MSSALQFMWDGGNTRRYHTMPTLQQDTVGHHSYNVACVIMALRPDCRKELLMAALKHDMAEHRVGDMPAPAKRALPDYQAGDGAERRTFREVFGEAEELHLLEARVPVEVLTEEEKWVLKFADALDGLRFCVQEFKMGNRLIAECLNNFAGYVEDLLTNGFGTTNDIVVFKKLWRDYNDLCK
jgi:5'-deoxynucleotidase YfbR-like HD superfamily hydrolase